MQQAELRALRFLVRVAGTEAVFAWMYKTPPAGVLCPPESPQNGTKSVKSWRYQ